MKLRSFSIYFFFNVLSALTPIVTLPLFTQYMSPEDYGNWTMFTLMAMYASTISRWEINNALKLSFIRRENDFQLHAGTAFVFACAWFALFLILWLTTLKWELGWAGLNNDWILAVGVLAFFRYHTVNLHQLLQIENRSLLYGVWSFLANICIYGLAISLLINFNIGWKARAWAEILVAAVSFVMAIIIWQKDYELVWRFDSQVLRQMLFFSSPLVISSMVGYLLITSDRLFIARLLDAEQLGLYAIAAQLSASATLIISAVVPTWEAAIYNHTGSLGDHIRKHLKLLIFFAMLAVAILILMPKLLIFILPYLTQKSFLSAEVYIYPTLMIVLSAGLFALLQPIAVLLHKGNVYMAINIGMLIVACAGMLLCIPVMGAQGAAYSLTAVYLIGGLFLIFCILKWTGEKRRKHPI